MSKWKITFTPNQRHLLMYRATKTHRPVMEHLLGCVLHSKTIDLAKIPFETTMMLVHEVSATISRSQGSRKMRATRISLYKKSKVLDSFITMSAVDRLALVAQ